MSQSDLEEFVSLCVAEEVQCHEAFETKKTLKLNCVIFIIWRGCLWVPGG